MGKYADSLDDYCPECANADGSEQNGMRPVSSEESDCSCCCCCCDCEESGGENPEASNSENSIDYKKNLLSNLSITRTVTQPASIQNVLQFIEALTNSRNFLSEYYLRENFCLDCLTEHVCDCYARSLRNLNLRDPCTCIDCREDGESNELCSNETNVPGGPESYISNAASSRSENRSNQRRRRRRLRRSRRHVSDLSEQNRLGNNSHNHHLKLTNDNFHHSERENESRRYRRRNQRCSPTSYCSSDECTPRTQMESNERCTCIFPDSFQPQDFHITDQCRECPTDYRNSTDNKCQLSDCELCNKEDSKTIEASDTCCSDCSLMQTAASACNCSNNPHQSSKESFETSSNTKKLLPSELKNISESSPQNKLTEDDKSDQSSCDCQECQSYSECSHDSCDECQSTKNNDRKSK